LRFPLRLKMSFVQAGRQPRVQEAAERTTLGSLLGWCWAHRHIYRRRSVHGTTSTKARLTLTFYPCRFINAVLNKTDVDVLQIVRSMRTCRNFMVQSQVYRGYPALLCHICKEAIVLNNPSHPAESRSSSCTCTLLAWTRVSKSTASPQRYSGRQKNLVNRSLLLTAGLADSTLNCSARLKLNDKKRRSRRSQVITWPYVECAAQWDSTYV
jgi:hypothetical protein